MNRTFFFSQWKKTTKQSKHQTTHKNKSDDDKAKTQYHPHTLLQLLGVPKVKDPQVFAFPTHLLRFGSWRVGRPEKPAADAPLSIHTSRPGLDTCIPLRHSLGHSTRGSLTRWLSLTLPCLALPWPPFSPLSS